MREDDYKFSRLPKDAPLPLEYVKKGKKGKGNAEREPDVTVNVKAEVIAAMEKFLDLELLRAATTGKSTNANEAFNNRAIAQLNGELKKEEDEDRCARA